MTDTLPDSLVAPLATLAVGTLVKTAFGHRDGTGGTAVAEASAALGLSVALVTSEASGGSASGGSASGDEAEPLRLRVAASAGLDAPPEPWPARGPWAEAMTHTGPMHADDLAPMEGGGTLLRVGSREAPLALVAVLGRPLGEGERVFMQAVATVLHARIALDRQRHDLAETERRARAIVETSVDGVITIDARGCVQSFNPGAERIFGYRAEQVIGENIHVLMPEPYRSEHDGYLQAYTETGVARIIGIGREVKGRRASGATFPMDLAVSEVHLADGDRLFVGLVRDISERRALEREVLRIAEEERRRIGQDLHDGLGQTLTGIGLFARTLARQLDAEGSPHAEACRQVVSLMDEADAHARALARSLVPVELERNGLVAALERMAERASQLYSTRVTAEAEGTGASEADVLPGTAATHLFRIAQEAVSNSAQHGRAELIRVRLIRGPDQLRLRVEDDGIGFAESLRSGGVLEVAELPGANGAPPEATGANAAGDELAAPEAELRSVSAPARPADHRGMGLRIMHYRANLAGGTLEIRPGADGGTVVTCTVQL